MASFCMWIYHGIDSQVASDFMDLFGEGYNHNACPNRLKPCEYCFQSISLSPHVYIGQGSLFNWQMSVYQQTFTIHYAWPFFIHVDKNVGNFTTKFHVRIVKKHFLYSLYWNWTKQCCILSLYLPLTLQKWKFCCKIWSLYIIINNNKC